MASHEAILAAVLATLTTGLQAFNGVVVRYADANDDVIEIPVQGIVTIGDEGVKPTPSEFGAGATVYDIEHGAEVLVQAKTRSRAHALRAACGAALAANTSLGGLCEGLVIGNADYAEEGGDGVEPLHSFSIPISVMTTDTNPLD
jgi:hypothetical protein